MNRPLAFVTCAARPEITADDGLVLRALGRGLEVLGVPWDSGDVDWRAFGGVVLRSCWDYHRRRREFESWLGRLDRSGVRVWNPASLVRWNLEKVYLRELAARGVPIPPTRWLPPGQGPRLDVEIEAAGWRRVVVKPTVAASSWRLFAAGPEVGAADQARLDALLADGGGMIQPRVPEVERQGEWSLVFFDGDLSHAVLKRPRPGEIRVQSDFGGSVETATPGGELAELGRRCLAAIEGEPLYARVDAVETAAGPLLMELELIEPQLFLDSDPAAPGRFAAAIRRRLSVSGPLGIQ